MITRKQLAEYIQSLPSSRKEIVQEIAIPMMDCIEKLEKEIEDDEVVHTNIVFENVELRYKTKTQARTITALEAERKKLGAENKKLKEKLEEEEEQGNIVNIALDELGLTIENLKDELEEIENGKVAEWEVEQSHHINRLICIGGEDKGQIHIPSKNTKTTARGMIPKRYMVTIKEIK